ncbi:MAG: Gfo/Idh/MocA family oxidoreductase [Verrucomicrobiota bacterium]|nr:Gfo/Idh/MocA family oxidoreductase [Verrucomicrobiota bacterium]
MLRGAIVGFGNVAQFGHWPSYASNGEVEIVAVIDQSEKRRAAAKSLKHSLGTFHSLGEVAPDAIDFVDICTPPSRHLEPMLQAIEHGWHVLCEKPLLLESDMVDQVRAKAVEGGVAVMPVHNWKYAPIIRAATKLLDEGAIGKLRRVKITTLRLRDAATVDESQPNWRRDPKIAGGGIVMDHGWHSIYLALHWFKEIPQEASAELAWPNEQSVESEATLELSFPSGETRIELSWNARERANRIRLTGDKGEIALDDDTLIANGESQRFDPGLTAGSHHADWFEAMLPDVLSAFRDPKKSRPIFEEAANCLTIIRRAYAVARAS